MNTVSRENLLGEIGHLSGHRLATPDDLTKGARLSVVSILIGGTPRDRIEEIQITEVLPRLVGDETWVRYVHDDEPPGHSHLAPVYELTNVHVRPHMAGELLTKIYLVPIDC